MKLAALFSSGKDSCFAIFKAIDIGHRVACLLNMKPSDKNSKMWHFDSSGLAKRQAELMGFPLIVIETSEDDEKKLKDLESGLKQAIDKYQIEGLVTGALFSKYQKNKITKVAEKLGLKVFSPLWQMEQEDYMNELIRSKFKFIFVRVAAEGLGKEWLGKVIDAKQLEELKKIPEINLAGEGGEFESLVIDCPLFERPLKYIAKDVIDEGNGSYRLEVE